MGVLGAGRGKGQIAGVLVDAGQQERGLHGCENLMPPPQLPNQQRRRGAHRLDVALAGTDRPGFDVMVPHQDLKALSGLERIHAIEPVPAAGVDHNQPLHALEVDLAGSVRLKQILVDGEKRLDIGVQGFGQDGSGFRKKQRGGNDGGKSVEIRVFVRRDDLHAVRLRACVREAPWNKNPRLDFNFITSGPAPTSTAGPRCQGVQTQPEVDRISRFDNTVFVAMAGGCRNEQVHSVHTGRDRPGIVASVSRVLFEQNCNIENVSQTMLQTEFAGIFIVSMPDGMTSDALHREPRFAPHAAGPHGAHQALRPRRGFLPAAECEPFVITTRGPDRKGLVAHISGVIARHGSTSPTCRPCSRAGMTPATTS